MYFDVDLSADVPTVSLQDIDNFREFQIEATGPRDRIAAALAPYASWDGAHAWFAPHRVQDLAGARGREADWQQGFAALRDYAAGHGYAGDAGTLRAHVEWRD